MKTIIKGMMILGGIAACSSMSAQNQKGVKVLPIPGTTYGMSDNGKWIITTVAGESGFMYNDETGEAFNLTTQ